MAKRKAKRKKKKKKPKKMRSINTLYAILHCKGGFHSDKRKKRSKSEKLWKEELDN